MSTQPTEKNDFIRTIIRDDLASGKHDSILTRFPLSQTDIYTLDM